MSAGSLCFALGSWHLPRMAEKRSYSPDEAVVGDQSLVSVKKARTEGLQIVGSVTKEVGIYSACALRCGGGR